MELSKRFSLDYLISGSSETARSRGPITPLETSSMDEALNVFVSPVLRQLEAAPQKRQRVFTLFDSVREFLPGTDIDGFRKVIKWMASSNLVTVVEPDPHGNDLIERKV